MSIKGLLRPSLHTFIHSKHLHTQPCCRNSIGILPKNSFHCNFEAFVFGFGTSCVLICQTKGVGLPLLTLHFFGDFEEFM